ncbi:Acyl-CoA synthetase (AMP-forming)/AMP-acid ligase II [Collimonas sp. OK307]|uniref:long-chain-fatty-acid--CoA ligase n=1 Tax=Collimonas sp. OK307 TaxID=1801620 RepID=UPI0008DFCF04|nr:long-chain-fatty-acid--CoA ligase [Collimonas sp. OK307]SFI00232.1 Acyl-CoA synthetase (AMP-forming)/AMP-acid ligase II [Collimonas sp. OK307]
MYITQGLHRALQQKPDAIAVRYAGNERSYKEFVERVARLAGALQALGMAPGDRVAMLALNSDLYLEYQFGVPWGGGALNPCNIRWSAAEIIYSLQDSESSILIVDDAFKAMAGQIVKDAKSVKHVIYAGQGEVPTGMLRYEALLSASEPIEDVCRRGDDLAGIFYTGGTTGFPKGVMLSHRNLCTSAMIGMAEGLAQVGRTYLHAAPMFHLADFGISLMHWACGNTHAVIPMFTPEAVLASISRDRVTDALLVPTMIQMLVDHPAMKNAADLSSLKRISYGASAISEAVLDRAMLVLPGVDFVQAYGMTELSPIATINHAWHHTVEGRKEGKLRSAGRASFGTEVKIVDADGVEVPRGTVGEVAVRGGNVMLGYWKSPEQTAEVIVNGWMHTGDGAYMDEDGFIFVVDRLKDMIISGGENIFSAEVENAIAQHSAVVACAVIGIPDPAWGETVHAVITIKPGSTITTEDVIAHCKSLIAGYKCPRSVAFVDALPLSGAGKILKTKLREPFWEGRSRKVG